MTCSIREPTVANPAQARLKPLKLKGAVSDRNQAVKPMREKLCVVKSLAKLVAVALKDGRSGSGHEKPNLFLVERC